MQQHCMNLKLIRSKKFVVLLQIVNILSEQLIVLFEIATFTYRKILTFLRLRNVDLMDKKNRSHSVIGDLLYKPPKVIVGVAVI